MGLDIRHMRKVSVEGCQEGENSNLGLGNRTGPSGH